MKTLKRNVLSGVVLFVFLMSGLVGFVTFNILQNDISIVPKDSDEVRAINIKEHIFTTQDGIVGAITYISQDNTRLDINGESYSLKSVVSASGAKYANEDESIIFWEHQGEAMIELGDNTYITSTLEKADILTFTIAPQTVDCIGVAPMKCLVVNGEYFYSPIEGFEYEEGTKYEIKVARTERENVQADASIYLYRLIEIIKSTKLAENSLLYNKLTAHQWVWKKYRKDKRTTVNRLPDGIHMPGLTIMQSVGLSP